MSQSQETTSTSDWHLHFEIPAMGSFSRSVQEAIKTGVITAKARKEIIQVFRTYITKYTVYPSSEQYVTVCQQLVTKYPKLKDEKGSSTFGSWRLSLRNAFKNFRRDYPKEEHSTSSTEPPSTKRALYLEEEEEIDDDEYEEALKKLKDLYDNAAKKNKGIKRKEVKRLMELTKTRRHCWIRTEHPLIMDVISKFPCLNSSTWLQREFKAIVPLESDFGSMENWLEWRRKIFEFSKVESASRPLIKKILTKLDAQDVHDKNNLCDAVCLELLYRLLFPRGVPKNVLFVKQFETCDVDIDYEVSNTEQSAPYLLLTGPPGGENSQVFVCCEQNVYLESKSVKEATTDLIATYFIFDIAYPKPLLPILVFIQHYLVELKDKQLIPATTAKLLGNLKKF